MTELTLALKKKWFDMTVSGEKTEDYREINAYWFARLVFDHKKVFKHGTGYDWDSYEYREELVLNLVVVYEARRKQFAFNPFDTNIMTLGYPSRDCSERILRLEHKGIEIRTGKPEWGAEPGKLYFVIKHGAILR